MAENARTRTRQESAARAGDGPGRQKQGRVTDAEGERRVLARGLRRPKPDQATGSDRTWRNLDPFSGRRESELAHRPKVCHRCVSPGNSRSMDRSGSVRKVSGPHAQVAVDGRVRKPAISAAVP